MQQELNLKNGQLTIPSINPSNRFDSLTYFYTLEAFQYVSQTQDTCQSVGFESFFKHFQDFFETHPHTPVPCDTTDFESHAVQDSLLRYLDLVADTNLNLQDYLTASFAFENSILKASNLSSVQKDIILYSISWLKQFRYVYQTEDLSINIKGIIYNLTDESWKNLFDECVRRELEEIYNNPVLLVIYIAAYPESWMAIFAACAYEASATYWGWSWGS